MKQCYVIWMPVCLIEIGMLEDMSVDQGNEALMREIATVLDCYAP